VSSGLLLGPDLLAEFPRMIPLGKPFGEVENEQQTTG
jgi:hypothetical protein